MTSVKQDAIDALSFHSMNPDTLLFRLSTDPTRAIVLEDEHHVKWTFVIRRRCRSYLMAKSAQMKRLEEIHSAHH